MNTGICKAIALLVMLAGCAEGLSTDTQTPAKPLREARMMQGDVILAAPDGYCIDRRNLEQSFAVLARCDTLGVAAGTAGAPLGLITVSLSSIAPGAAPVTAAHFEAGLSPAKVLDSKQMEEAVLVRVQGVIPIRPGLSLTHWRGAARVGAYRMGVAIYGADQTPVTQRAGGEILENLIRRTLSKSRQSIAGTTGSKDTPPKKGLGATIAGLFD